MKGTAICTRVAGYLSGRPLFIEPHALKGQLDAMAPRLGLSAEAEGAEEGDIARMQRVARHQRLATILEAEPIPVADGMGEYALTADGIAVIPIIGTLVGRFDWLAAWCGFCSYDGLKATIQEAARDERVKAILLDVDSPGGEAAGMLDVADAVRAAAAAKPVWAHANPLAASAAYGIAAGAQRLCLPRLGAVGSIGVVAIHVDQSGADAEYGLKFTALYSGARKVDGWGHAPLSREAKARFQEQLDEARLKFATAVGEFRGLSAEAVMDTEAGVYDDTAAVEAGLADAVEPFEATLAALTERVRSGGSSLRGAPARSLATTEKDRMATKTAPAKTSAETPETTADDEQATAPAAAAQDTDEDEEDPKDKPKAKPKGKKSEPMDDEEEPKAAKTISLEAAAEIADIVTQANTMWPGLKANASQMIKSGQSPEQIRKSLWDKAAKSEIPISSHVMPDAATTADGGWGTAVAKVNGRK